MFPSYLEVEVPSYFEPENTGSLLFGDQKMQFTTVIMTSI